MKQLLLFAMVAGSLGPLCAQPYDGIGKPAAALGEMEPVLAKIAAWEYNQSHEPLFQFDEFLQGKLSSPAEVRKIESRLLALLPQATMAGKQYICRQLGLIGTAAAVPALAKLLATPETNDMARSALERIPGDASAGALRGALKGSAGKPAVGIINSLGQRRDTASIPALKPLLADRDEAIAEAAAAALALIGGRAPLDSLAAARLKAGGTLRPRLTDALLECAGTIPAGDQAAALKIYRQLNSADEAETVRVTALGGIARLAGARAVGEMQKELGSPSPAMRAAAVRLLSAMPGPETGKLLIDSYAKAPADVQVRIVAALAGRGDATARPLVNAAAAPGGEPAVRKAALEALAKIGDPSSVAVLAAAAAEETAPAAESPEGGRPRRGAPRASGSAAIARESLNTIRGEGVDQAIIDGIGGAGGEKVRLELIRAAGARGMTNAAAALLRASEDPAREVRRESLRALRTTAGPAQTKPLLALLVRAQNAGDRRDATSALAAAVKRSGPPGADDLLAAYNQSDSVPVKVALLDVLGHASAPAALPALRQALASGDAEISRAAILALSGWQSPEPMGDLLELAKKGAGAQQVLALRGYIALISAPSARTIPETVELIATAMAIAGQAEEKRALLALLPFYPTEKALSLAEGAVKDEAVSREARYAVSRVRLALDATRRQ